MQSFGRRHNQTVIHEDSLASLSRQIRQCRLCERDLPLAPRPVFRGKASAKTLIVGQAPGIRVHRSGTPFDDPSGDRLRQWMGIDADVFYNEWHIAIIPMAFCYPGSGERGDLPPLRRCAQTWRERLLEKLPDISLTILLGQYAIDWHLAGRKKPTLTQTVRHWREYAPCIPLPHPSPRNNIWLKKNPWFAEDVLPELRRLIRAQCSGKR